MQAAVRLSPGEVDFLELRVDEFAHAPERIEAALPGLRAPLIVTVRHPLEGGAGGLDTARRRELFERFLPHAALADVELRSVSTLAGVLGRARELGVGVILSYHDFRRTPSPERMRALRLKAARAGATIFKLAAVAETAAEAARLLGFLTSRGPNPPALAVMGMGRFGKMSRLALGHAGSVLNYGYLDEPQVSGQWPAVLLKQRLGELEA